MKQAFRIRSLALLLTIGSGSEALATPRLPEVLAPASACVNYREKKCVAARQFGMDKARTTLILEQYSPGDMFTLTLAGPRFKGAEEGGFKPRYRFGPAEAEQDFDFLTGDLGKETPALLGRRTISIMPMPEAMVKAFSRGEGAEWPPLSDDRLAAVRTFDLHYRGRDVQLQTGRLDKLLKAMHACTDNLVKSWGFDPSVMKSLSQGPRPTGSPQNWLREGDYPAESISRGQRALVSLRLNIDEKGAVTACDILQATRDGSFGKLVCDVLPKRAKFLPALDASGRPVAAYFVTRAIFLTE